MPLLAHAIVAPPVDPSGQRAVTRWMLFLHGILGSGANWRTFAKQIVESRPGWGAVLVDLRLHGESGGFAPPHTVTSAAEDVLALATSLEGDPRLGGGAVRGVLGHSFGGKIALRFAALRGDLDHAFVVDSTPSARPDRRGSEDTQHIVDLLRELPDHFPDRESFLAWSQARGVSRPTAMWLAMNVKPVPNTTRYVFRLDVPGIRAMLEDYFLVDAWGVVESPPASTWVHLVVGGRSSILDEADRERARLCAERPGSRTTLDVIPEAGHWVHADAPEALRAVVLRHLDGA